MSSYMKENSHLFTFSCISQTRRDKCRIPYTGKFTSSNGFGFYRSFLTGNSWHSCTLQSLEIILYGLQQPVIYKPKWFVNILQTSSFLNLEKQLERKLNFDPVCTSEIHISIWYVIAWASVLKYTKETLSPFQALAFFSTEVLFTCPLIASCLSTDWLIARNLALQK